ncbi:CpsD/CapB family tyrosine-protein kinase [uncultured Clostridium sp.]|nr:CpsD/CapB family tyrosine-protein kinase [uncultured Clostridium sp.]
MIYNLSRIIIGEVLIMFAIARKPKSTEAESYRRLRTNIEYSSFDDKYKVIVVTSSFPEEGKSTTAGNLAISMSDTEKKVLLIDCDIRKPSLHKKFKISNSKGLTELIMGRSSFDEVSYKYNENLTVITSGSKVPNPSELLASEVMNIFLQEARENFDYVVIDTPPVQLVTDAQILSSKADGTLLVVKAESTKKNQVASSVGLLRKVNATVMGTVLNAVKNTVEKKYNYYE